MPGVHAQPAGERAARVSTLELFFDLVFVFTVTQLTALLTDEPDAGGAVRVVVLLLVIWWMYDGYAWLTNALSLDALAHRLVLLGGMGGFLVMALVIPTSFDDGAAWRSRSATCSSSRSTAASTSARPLPARRR